VTTVTPDSTTPPAEETSWKPSIAFAFRDPGAADRAYDGAAIRLAGHLSPEGVLTGLSVGQVAAAIKAEARSLEYEPQLVRLRDENQEPVALSFWAMYGGAAIFWGLFFLVAIALLTAR
jgi:hypothetical protein